jgi:vacuolar protein sorting-associated protein 29
VNPGSATGAWSGLWNGYVTSRAVLLQRSSSRRIIADMSSDATPSFALLDVQGPVIVTYVYQLVEGEVSSSFVPGASLANLSCTLPHFHGLFPK